MRYKSGFKSEFQFYHDFNNAQLSYTTIQGKTYSIKAIRPNKRNVPYDCSINIGNRIVAIVDVKYNKFIYKIENQSLIDFAVENDIRYVVMTNGRQFYVKDLKDDTNLLVLDFLEFCLLMSEKIEVDIEQNLQQISNTFIEFVNNSEFQELKNLISESDNKLKNIEYDEIQQFYSFKKSNEINSFENSFFNNLLESDLPTQIYRYTTLPSIFAMLDYNSFRLNCLVGMNDTTEVDYAENYIYGVTKDVLLKPWQTIESYNKRFIASCTTKKDDLTQWRLYAEDCKGVCLKFNIRKSKLNDKFIVKRISYGNEDKTHPKLDLVKDIVQKLKAEYGIDFRFRSFNTWKHFFKPFDYQVEDEVRILYIQQKDDNFKKSWLLTNSHNILNPFVELPLNAEDLPIYLKEIILGPKSPEKTINKRQFEQFIRELRSKKGIRMEHNEKQEYEIYNINDLEVSISDITNYR